MTCYRAMLKQNCKTILGTCLIAVLSSAAMVFAGLSLSFFFSAYEQPTNRITALVLTFLLELLIWGGAMGLYYLSLLAKCHAKKLLRHKLRSMIASKISELDYQQLQQKDCGNFVSWLTNDADQLYEQSFAAVFCGVEALATWVFSLGTLFLLGTCIGVSALLLLAFISILPQLAAKYLQKANSQRSLAMEKALESYKDTVMGANIFVLCNLRKQLTERIADASQKAEQSDCSFNRTNVGVQILISASSLLGQVVLLFVSFLAAVLGAAVPGAVLSVANLSGSFFNGVGDFTQAFAKIKACSVLWQKFALPDDCSYRKQKVGAVAAIHFADVSFGYQNHLVLKKANYSFDSMGKYAIIGESGSGKSTLVKILLGLLPEYTGGVYYDKLEQKEIFLPSLYNQIAYVDQQVYLFEDTLRFNITLGQPYSDVQIHSVLAQCRLEEFAASFPNGLDTIILENGKNLSGGQRQRIALARSLIRNVKWIILDEGTSALDQANAAEIENRLIDRRDLGVILITHHLRESLRPKLTGIYEIAKQQ